MLMFACLWIAALLLFAPPLAFFSGLLLQHAAPLDAPQLLQVSFFSAALLVSAAIFICRRLLDRFAVQAGLEAGQALCICLFVVAVALPRLLASGIDIPVAIYDDNWHLQKIVTVFATFPDFKHYLFPDLAFSYYFYAYIMPAAAYTLKPGLNLKMVWAGYLGLVSGVMSLLLVMCFNLFLPESSRIRRLFALAITFIGGLHEWPSIAYAWRSGMQNWHTEWWAEKIDLPLQVSSFYTSHVWAPQHVLALGLFGIIYCMLHGLKRTVPAGLLIGMLLGIQAGFSLQVALFSGLYIVLYVLIGMAKDPKQHAALAFCCVPGLALALLPIAGSFLDKEGTIFLSGSASQLPRYILFLFIEFGGLMVLFGLYCYGVLRRRVQPDHRAFANILFILATFAILFCVQSKGFNVFYYRGMLPAQVLICFAAMVALNGTRPLVSSLVIALVCIQAVAFVPEMMAVTKRNLDARNSTFRLSEEIIRINREAALGELISIPYRKDVDGFMLNTYVNNIFRMKDVARQFYCEGKIDKNNLVYLDNSGVQSLQAACRQESENQSLTVR